MATILVLDFDNPSIGVEVYLAREIFRGLVLPDEACRKAIHPSPLCVATFKARRSGPVKLHGAIKSIYADIYRPGVFIAAARDKGGCAFDLAAAQIRLNPDLALDTHRTPSPFTGVQ